MTSRIGTNSGHGHAWTRPDGIRARCGGRGLCAECSRDSALLQGNEGVEWFAGEISKLKAALETKDKDHTEEIRTMAGRLDEMGKIEIELKARIRELESLVAQFHLVMDQQEVSTATDLHKRETELMGEIEKLKVSLESTAIQHRAWTESFGTTQLTHAKAFIESLEHKCSALKAQLEREREALKEIAGFPIPNDGGATEVNLRIIARNVLAHTASKESK